ncbi:hypothetical protein [Nocardia transvalensis]|uniref:hypothetical protein n=1 Tax=Nocardia transvalensis TaxID=37333 RepID=UPI001892F537|nr:hypothetical protein [Nocardia transvalensis]MBF6333490.1 hypothetical protein [Nocardia transvalensis]
MRLLSTTAAAALVVSGLFFLPQLISTAAEDLIGEDVSSSAGSLPPPPHIDWSAAVEVTGAVVGVVLLICAIGGVLTAGINRCRARRGERRARRRRWEAAVTSWNQLRCAVTDVEVGPGEIERRVQLGDLDDRDVTTFWDAFTDADRACRPVPPATEHELADFETAVEIAWRAWTDLSRRATPRDAPCGSGARWTRRLMAAARGPLSGRVRTIAAAIRG